MNVKRKEMTLEEYEKYDTYLYTIKDIEVRDKEIERLNNIINELEESTETGYYKYNSSDSDYIDGYNDGASQTAEFFHNKIKELKENDKQ